MTIDPFPNTLPSSAAPAFGCARTTRLTCSQGRGSTRRPRYIRQGTSQLTSLPGSLLVERTANTAQLLLVLKLGAGEVSTAKQATTRLRGEQSKNTTKTPGCDLRQAGARHSLWPPEGECGTHQKQEQALINTAVAGFPAARLPTCWGPQ